MLDVMTQVAACHHGVGVAFCAEPVLVELRGCGAELDTAAHALVHTSPETGGHVPAPWGWWLRQTRHRAVAVADAANGGALRAALAEAASAADVVATDRSAGHVAVVLAGPLAGRVAATAATLFAPVLSVADGDDYRLLLVPAADALGAYQFLLAAGRDDGAVAVGMHAIGIHRAARRVRARQRLSNPRHPGAPTP